MIQEPTKTPYQQQQEASRTARQDGRSRGPGIPVRPPQRASDRGTDWAAQRQTHEAEVRKRMNPTPQGGWERQDREFRQQHFGRQPGHVISGGGEFSGQPTGFGRQGGPQSYHRPMTPPGYYGGPGGGYGGQPQFGQTQRQNQGYPQMQPHQTWGTQYQPAPYMNPYQNPYGGRSPQQYQPQYPTMNWSTPPAPTWSPGNFTQGGGPLSSFSNQWGGRPWGGNSPDYGSAMGRIDSPGFGQVDARANYMAGAGGRFNQEYFGARAESEQARDQYVNAPTQYDDTISDLQNRAANTHDPTQRGPLMEEIRHQENMRNSVYDSRRQDYGMISGAQGMYGQQQRPSMQTPAFQGASGYGSAVSWDFGGGAGTGYANPDPYYGWRNQGSGSGVPPPNYQPRRAY